METNLLDRMLDAYQTSQTSVTVTLQNKIRVSGKIRAFDSYVIVMEGQKHEILYRHAVSCIAPQIADGQKHPATASRATPTKDGVRPPEPAGQKSRQIRQPAALSAGAPESSINNSMKEGLLRWMKEQKASK